MKPATRFRLAALVLVTGAFVACSVGELNPQPLPPVQNGANGTDAGATVVVTSPYADAGNEGDFGADAAAPPPLAQEDGGIVTPDASTDAGIDEDASDASDAAIN